MVAAVLMPRTFHPVSADDPCAEEPDPRDDVGVHREVHTVLGCGPRAGGEEEYEHLDKAAPSATNALVRSPAIRERHWRSAPMSPPARKAIAARPRKSKSSAARWWVGRWGGGW